jgi:hypothetical protein
MKHLVDIHVVLATAGDMEQWEEQAEDAADKLNHFLHCLYDKADDDIASTQLERMMQHIWETWSQDTQLMDIDDTDIVDWVDQLLASWEDVSLDSDTPHF